VNPRLVAAETSSGLRRNPAMTLAVVVTVAISLALLGTGVLMRAQVAAMKDYWYDKVEVSVFLDRTVTADQKADVERRLRDVPVVADVFFESRDEAFGRFTRQFRDNPELVRNITPAALPESFRVKLDDPTQYAAVAAALQGQPGVGQVVDQRRLLDRFFTLLNGLQTAALAFAVTQVVAAGVLIANTVRLSVYSRRREVSVMRLVGATGFYIRLPFMLQAAASGLAGTTAAVGVLVAMKAFFVDGRLRQAFPLTAFVGWAEVRQASALLVVLGVALPVAAATGSLRRHLRT
jgi:cell division transport system permease protein